MLVELDLRLLRYCYLSVKNDIETLFFWKQASNSGCALYTAAHYTRVDMVYNLFLKESKGLVVEFV